ncbi:hypothetical protein [Hydrogenophaga sp. T2]|uniref:hypothetical protein n=1 Tax=Hydrogenophaga sp. T2 TaxID=3132823 RepID=UPI003CF6E2CE
MTDRELLELAAKAAGYTVRCVGDGRHGGNVVFYMEPSQLYWNPLTDDGDALRLAVKLGLRIDPDMEDRILVIFGLHTASKVGEIREPQPSDPYAATRRAIVRAAAELGKAMP